MFFLKVMAKFIGIILIFTGISALIALIVAFFTIGITDAVHFPPMNFIDAANAANIPMWLMSMLLFFAVGIPFFFVFYLGLKILVNNLKSIGNIAKFTLLGLWLMAIIGLVITGVKQATEHAFDAKVTRKEQLDVKANDTLKLSMIGNHSYGDYFRRSDNNYRLTEEDNGRTITSSDIRLVVKSTKDSLATIIIEKEASGSNYNVARTRAKNISYKYVLINNELQLNAFLSTDIDNKFSEQEVLIILYLPEGTVLYADENTYSFHRNSNYYNDILENGMEEHYLKIIEDDTECLDCGDGEENEEEKIDAIETSDQKESSNDDKPEVTLQINDEDGVILEVNDNWDNLYNSSVLLNLNYPKLYRYL